MLSINVNGTWMRQSNSICSLTKSANFPFPPVFARAYKIINNRYTSGIILTWVAVTHVNLLFTVFSFIAWGTYTFVSCFNIQTCCLVLTEIIKAVINIYKKWYCYNNKNKEACFMLKIKHWAGPLLFLKLLISQVRIILQNQRRIQNPVNYLKIELLRK